MNLLDDVFSGGKAISIVNDPFNKKSIESISMHVSKGSFDGKFYSWGYVKFKNGNTEAKQEFRADTFPELYTKINEFIKTL